MKILKLPNSIDPLRKIRRVTLERDLVCPFCGNKREVIDDIINCGIDIWARQDGINFVREKWYGQKSGKPYLFKQGKEIREWEKNVCACKKCGGEWEGDPYPIDILEEINEKQGDGLKAMKF